MRFSNVVVLTLLSTSACLQDAPSREEAKVAGSRGALVPLSVLAAEWTVSFGNIEAVPGDPLGVSQYGQAAVLTYDAEASSPNTREASARLRTVTSTGTLRATSLPVEHLIGPGSQFYTSILWAHSGFYLGGRYNVGNSTRGSSAIARVNTDLQPTGLHCWGGGASSDGEAQLEANAQLISVHRNGGVTVCDRAFDRLVVPPLSEGVSDVALVGANVVVGFEGPKIKSFNTQNQPVWDFQLDEYPSTCPDAAPLTTLNNVVGMVDLKDGSGFVVVATVDVMQQLLPSPCSPRTLLYLTRIDNAGQIVASGSYQQEALDQLRFGVDDLGNVIVAGVTKTTTNKHIDVIRFGHASLAPEWATQLFPTYANTIDLRGITVANEGTVYAFGGVPGTSPERYGFIGVVLGDGSVRGSEIFPDAVVADAEMDTYGNALWGLVEHTGELTLSRFVLDRDRDGIPDEWEILGIPFGLDGARYDLHQFGVSPEHKDILIEIDAMVGQNYSEAVWGRVRDAFAAAPLSNPDEVDGVHLFLGVDDTNLPAVPWLNTDVGFNTTKSAFFGTAFERSQPDWSSRQLAKAKVFHYAILALEDISDPDTEGVGELNGNDFVLLNRVSQSELLRRAAGPNPAFDTQVYQASVFMHELGHNLGLDHGGIDDINNKPNYHSVMNYMWQDEDARRWPYAVVDYSHAAAPPINEMALDESIVAGGPEHASHPVRIHSAGPVPWSTIESTQLEGGPIDYNGDGDTSDVLLPVDYNHDGDFFDNGELGVDVNGDGQIGILFGSDDWDLIRFPLWRGPFWEVGFSQVDVERESAYYAAAHERRERVCEGDHDPGRRCECESDGATRSCGSDRGACRLGVQTCEDGNWSSCEGETSPGIEFCDGVDNDCDGSIDEDSQQLGDECATGGLGACRGTGEWACAGDGGLYCTAVAGQPSVERCENGVDEDCDGEIDEGFDALGSACDLSVGICQRTGTMRCYAGELRCMERPIFSKPTVQGSTAAAPDEHGMDEECFPPPPPPPPPPSEEESSCGSITCAAGEVCCNASCSLCAAPGAACTQELCVETSAE